MVENERLARIEEALKGVGRSIDGVRDTLDKHIEDEDEQRARADARTDALETDLTAIKAGSKVLMWVCGILPVTGGAFYAIVTWVNKIGAIVKGAHG
jgi:hypothetical protein